MYYTTLNASRLYAYGFHYAAFSTHENFLQVVITFETINISDGKRKKAQAKRTRKK